MWGPQTDQLLADENVSSLGSAGNTLWTLADHLATIRDIADQNESTYATTVANHRVFNAFGSLTSETNSSVGEVFAFTGRMRDDVTGLQNNLNRWYDPGLGQWLSEDPIGFEAGDSNIRRYVGHDVLRQTDPTGLVQPLSPFGNPINSLGPTPTQMAARIDEDEPLINWTYEANTLGAILSNPLSAYGGGVQGGGQGWLNILNGLTDTATAYQNNVAWTYNNFTPQGILSSALGLGMPYAPSLGDWSRDILVKDEYFHNASKFIGSQAVLTLASAGWVSWWGATGRPTFGLGATSLRSPAPTHAMFNVNGRWYHAGAFTLRGNLPPTTQGTLPYISNLRWWNNITGIPILNPTAPTQITASGNCLTTALRAFYAGWFGL